MALRRMPSGARLLGVGALLVGVAAACGSEVSTVRDGAGGAGGDPASSTSIGSAVATTTGGGGGSSSTSGGGEGGEGGGATGGGGTTVAPPFRNPVDGPDGEVALRALQLLGAPIDGAEDGCVPCHALSEANLRSWEGMTNGVLGECLTDLDVPSQQVAEEMLDCVRARTGVPSPKYAAHGLGFWAAAARRPWWRYVFEVAYPDDFEARYEAFLAQVQMPADGEETLTEDELDVVSEWFVRGAPLLDELLAEDPPPGGCDVHLQPAIAAHVDAMQTQGWRAVNAGRGMLMHGCAGADDPRDCLADRPPADGSWVGPGGGVLKLLTTTSFASAFWTRGSSAGRYVGQGSWQFQGGSAIHDLQTGTTIAVNAAYDPAFFPDDRGFVFQGGPSGNVCAMKVLAGAPDLITMAEPGCSSIDEVGLYQHVGAALGGGDYFAVSGAFVSDDGGHHATLHNPEAYFHGGSHASLTPMIFDGTSFQPRPTITVPTPHEGDATLSHSARLLLSRVAGPQGRQNGYSLRRVDATPDGQGSYDVEIPVVGRYCIDGGKPAFSFDERWVVLHRYVEPTNEDAQELGFTGVADPGFAPYLEEGAANVWLLELATNRQIRVTDMSPGQYALFPSFRSDGWIYFVVRQPGTQGEAIVASDAALVAEAQ